MKTIDRNRKMGFRTFAFAGLTGVLAFGVAGCKSKDVAAPIVGPDGGDPAAANMAQPYTGGTAGGYGANPASGTATGTPSKPTRVLSSSQRDAGQTSGEDYSDPYGQENGQQAPAPIIQQAPAGYDPNAQGGAYGGGYTDAEEAGAEAIANTDQAPPPLPEYDQPPAPDPNYLWTPGYWNYASAGYYWVPGIWVAPPYYGALWTPPFWGFYGGHYRFHRGYWGPHVGFYGGINYGFGYIGTGYYGGYWRGHDFFYNRAVTNVNLGNVHNVYDRAVVYDNHTYGPRPENRVDFVGGRGGLNARPNPSEMAALHEAHYAPVPAQRDNRVAAQTNHGQFFGTNGGRPATAFAARPAGSVQNIAAVPREQPFNHGATPGVAGRPNEGAANGFAAGTARPGAEPGRGAPAITARPGPEPVRNGFGGNTGQTRAGFAAGRNPTEAGPRPEGNALRGNVGNGAAATGSRPTFDPQRERGGGSFEGGRPSATMGRSPGPAAPTEQRAAPVERPAMPAQRQAAPAFHPEAAPVQRQASPAFHPEAAPRAAPAPAAAPHGAAPAAAPHAGGGGGEHGGHH